MLKIFMTGDNHIGLKYASHEKASILASARLEAFECMVKCANEEDCGLFVITGDLFENSISKRDVKALVDMLSLFRGTVAVLPGNHDYYDRDMKLWQYLGDAVSTKDNILLLCEYRPYELEINGEEVVLYPALCTSRHSAPGENNLGRIPGFAPDSKYRIGIAHGAIEGETIDSEGAYFSMTRAELEAIPVDAWLIGHTHVPFPKNLTTSPALTTERIFNAGTHLQTDVSCNTEGLCFILEIDSEKNIKAKKWQSGNLRFYRRTLSVSDLNLENALSDIGDNSVVDLILSGAVTAEEYENRHSLISSQLDRFIEGTYNDYSLSKLITPELVASEFPETSFSAGLLSELLDEPKEAQLMYELLKELRGGR